MRNKFLSVIAIMFVVLVSFTNIYATDGMFHMGIYEDIYRLSEQLEDIELPFVNVFVDAATYDKNVTHSGISIGETTIDVDEKLEGVHVLFSNDMITIKGEVEHAFIYGSNVVVEGKIAKDTIIFAPTVQILEGAIVEEDVIIVANNLELKGKVNGNVIATVSNTATISGIIDKDLRITAMDLELTGEQINGDVYIETNIDTTSIKEKYSNAIINAIEVEQEEATDWMGIFTKGIITVVIYSIICLFLTRKPNNLVEKAYKKFKENTTYGLIISVIMLMLVFILPIILIILAIAGLGIIAWPILTIYLAVIIFVISTASLIVGTTIFMALKDKVGKYKIPVVAIIFGVLYALTKITVIATYANLAILLIALAIVVTMITKKLPDTKNEEVKA